MSTETVLLPFQEESFTFFLVSREKFYNDTNMYLLWIVQIYSSHFLFIYLPRIQYGLLRLNIQHHWYHLPAHSFVSIFLDRSFFSLEEVTLSSLSALQNLVFGNDLREGESFKRLRQKNLNKTLPIYWDCYSLNITIFTLTTHSTKLCRFLPFLLLDIICCLNEIYLTITTFLWRVGRH